MVQHTNSMLQVMKRNALSSPSFDCPEAWKMIVRSKKHIPFRIQPPTLFMTPFMNTDLCHSFSKSTQEKDDIAFLIIHHTHLFPDFNSLHSFWIRSTSIFTDRSQHEEQHFRSGIDCHIIIKLYPSSNQHWGQLVRAEC